MFFPFGITSRASFDPIKGLSRVKLELKPQSSSTVWTTIAAGNGNPCLHALAPNSLARFHTAQGFIELQANECINSPHISTSDSLTVLSKPLGRRVPSQI